VPGEELNSTAGVEGARLMREAEAEVVTEFVAEFVAEFVFPRSSTPRSSTPFPPTVALFADNPKDS